MARSDEMMRVASKRYWRESDARVAVDAWRRSGAPLAGFAREHGVEAARVSRWAARLGAGDSAMRFHPVRLVGATRSVASREPIEVVLENGRRLRVPPGFVDEDLRRVLEVLEGSARC